MQKRLITILTICAIAYGATAQSQTIPNIDDKETLQTLIKVNDHFMSNWPDPTKPTFVNRERSSNLWTRAVYYEGLMALYSIYPSDKYWQYIMDWGNFHGWKPRNGCTDRNADNYCCSQTYLDVYNITRDWNHAKWAKVHADMLVNTPSDGDWTWIDAIQMGMPVLSKMYAITGDTIYSRKAADMYHQTRDVIGGGLFNREDGLWWRDAAFVPPYTEPNGKDCYWSRGNGWVYAALARVIPDTPTDRSEYNTYLEDFKAMSRAIVDCQREDGFWNCSLHDPGHFGGKELTGTALFVYGLAWGINNGILERDLYLEPCLKGWNAIVTDAIHPDGYLGYVQGTGKEPKDGQPTAYDSRPDFDDYGTGCVLLAGTEIYKMSK